MTKCSHTRDVCQREVSVSGGSTECINSGICIYLFLFFNIPINVVSSKVWPDHLTSSSGLFTTWPKRELT